MPHAFDFFLQRLENRPPPISPIPNFVSASKCSVACGNCASEQLQNLSPPKRFGNMVQPSNRSRLRRLLQLMGGFRHRL
jgi:endonuclease YncB( thermonuclease family)